jgi:hypothetical protein
MERIIMLLVIMALSLMGIASAVPVISVSPQPTDVTLNETFTAEVTVDPVDGEIYAISYDLHFNPDILKATEQTQGDFLSRDDTETFVVVNVINNTIGKITYGESRTGENGVTTIGTLSSITFTVIGDGISDLALDNVLFDDLAAEPKPTPTPDSPQKPFLIHGYVCYDDGSLCNNPSVSITNLNTSEEWEAETGDGSNYYQITLASGIDLNATETLRFNVTDGTNSYVTGYTITIGDVGVGGLFNFNLAIASLKVGDVNGDGNITSVDAAIALQMAVRGEYSKVADVNGDDRVTSLDALMIQQATIDQITI